MASRNSITLTTATQIDSFLRNLVIRSRLLLMEPHLSLLVEVPRQAVLIHCDVVELSPTRSASLLHDFR